MSDLTNRLQRAHRTQTGFLDVVTEIGELEARLVAIRSAWNIPGPSPRYHERMKDKLAHEWPALHHALTQACETSAQRTGEDQSSERGHGAGSLAGGRPGRSGARTPSDRWGTCCPSDPECDHSFLELADLTRWLITPISDNQAKEIEAWSRS